MKVIFLDIDGVLAPTSKSMEVEPGNYPFSVKFSKKNVDNLNFLLKKTGAKLVISSSWINKVNFKTVSLVLASHGIIGPYVTPKDLGEKKEVSNYAWLSDDNIFYGRATTPRKMSSTKREEISFWLNDFKGKYSKYIILDDDKISESLIQIVVDHEKGLSKKDVNKAIKVLNE